MKMKLFGVVLIAVLFQMSFALGKEGGGPDDYFLRGEDCLDEYCSYHSLSKESPITENEDVIWLPNKEERKFCPLKIEERIVSGGV